MDLYSNIIGSGKPFIILHGFLGMGDNWKTLARQFAEDGYEVHLVDQRNHGKSFHDAQFNYTVMAQDLKKYCDDQNLDQIILLGHSMGGKIAMKFATMYPDKITKLIVADIAPKYYAPHHQDILNSLNTLANTPEALTSRGDADDFLKKHITDWGTRQFLLKNLYWKKDKTLGLRINLEVLSKKMEEIGESLEENEIFLGKTLFLKGEKSNYITEGDKNIVNKHFPNSTLQTIKKAGHWLHAENPKQFYDEVIIFL